MARNLGLISTARWIVAGGLRRQMRSGAVLTSAALSRIAKRCVEKHRSYCRRAERFNFRAHERSLERGRPVRARHWRTVATVNCAMEGGAALGSDARMVAKKLAFSVPRGYMPAANGSLQIASFPSFADTWGDSCNWDTASADGWIGLYVGSYDLTGAPTAPFWNNRCRCGATVHGGAASGHSTARTARSRFTHHRCKWIRTSLFTGGGTGAAGGAGTSLSRAQGPTACRRVGA